MVPGQLSHFPLSRERARQIIREAAAASEGVFFTRHAEERMRERDITHPQVLRVLRSGAIFEGPARGIKGDWECRVEGICAGDRIGVAVALEPDEERRYVLVITTFVIG